MQMSVPQVFIRPKETTKLADAAKAQFAHPEEGDHLTRLNGYYSATRHVVLFSCECVSTKFILPTLIQSCYSQLKAILYLFALNTLMLPLPFLQL
jgi:hypothetical protein